MHVTEVFDINDQIKWAVYKKWQEEDIASTSADTYAKVKGVWSQSIPSNQTQFLNPSLLIKVAEGWQTIKDYLWKNPFNPVPDSSLDITSFEKCSLLFNEDVLRFCSENGILPECFKYHKAFIETFKYIQGITITVSHDYELPDYSKINFVLILVDEIENVLRYEDEFKKKIRKEINGEKRRYFTYNYNLV
jgi:hypothetical protein